MVMYRFFATTKKGALSVSAEVPRCGFEPEQHVRHGA